MAGFVPGESSSYGTTDNGPHRNSADGPEESGGRWYFSRKEIEECPPSRKDDIDLKKETYLRKSYCTFLQDLGMRLKVPQVTIATAIIFCHRFFIRQSHAKNDRRTIATVCMFLAGKVEETPRPLKDVILVSYEIINKKDPAAAQRIKQKEVYEQQKELILQGERVVLATLGFDFNVHHPYKPLVEAIKKFKVAQNALAQVAWNFVNDGLRTSLCLQFKPHHIAAGAIFLAAKFLKVKLPSDGEKVWWQEFDVTPRQLEEVSNQMLELYEQNRAPAAQGSEVEGSIGGGPNHRASAKVSSENDEQAARQVSSRPPPEHLHPDNHVMPPRSAQNQINDSGSAEMGSVITDHRVDKQVKDREHSPQNDNVSELTNKSKYQIERVVGEDKERNGPVGQSPREAIKIDKDKVKAALEKRRKSRGEMAMTQKKDVVVDEDDLIERELEDGIELAVVEDKKGERRGKTEEPDQEGTDNAEEGEMLDDALPKLSSSRKRKGESLSSPERQPEAKKRNDSLEDGHRRGRVGYADRDSRRHAQENHL